MTSLTSSSRVLKTTLEDGECALVSVKSQAGLTACYRTTVKDKLHGTNVELTEEELDLIHRLAKGENPDSSYDP